MRAAQHPSPAHNHSIPAQYTQSQHMVTAHGRTRSQHRCRAATAFIRSTQSQHTITTCNHSTQSQRTVTTHDHSTRSQHTVTAHGHSPSHTHLTAVDRCGALVDVLVPDAVQRPQHRISTTTPIGQNQGQNQAKDTSRVDQADGATRGEDRDLKTRIGQSKIK